MTQAFDKERFFTVERQQWQCGDSERHNGHSNATTAELR